MSTVIHIVETPEFIGNEQSKFVICVDADVNTDIETFKKGVCKPLDQKIEHYEIQTETHSTLKIEFLSTRWAGAHFLI